MVDDLKDVSDLTNDEQSTAGDGNKGHACGGDVLREQNQQLRRQLDYLAADFDTFRRRAFVDCQAAASDARSKIFVDLLSLVDDFESALKEIEREARQDVAAHTQGFRLMYQTFSKMLERYGITQVATEGIFDPFVHEAVMQRPAPEGVVAGTILDVLQKGYRSNGTLLRPAKVVVAQ